MGFLLMQHGGLSGRFDGSPGQCDEAARFYRHLLSEDILPWWTRHALDREAGGLCSCIRDDGRIVSYDKYVWSQVRALWTFSAAYNRIERVEQWRAAAEAIFRFIARAGQREDGSWNFLLNRDGTVKEGAESIQTDAFAICGLVEYARMTGSDEAVEAARRTAASALVRLGRPGSYRTKPYPIPEGTKAHRVSMQFSLSFTELGKCLGDPQFIEHGLRLTDEVLEHFRRPERQAVVEYLSLENAPLPPPIGTYMSPGHGIETAWFQLENLRGRAERERVEKALEIMRWSCEKGWDRRWGGLLLGLDLDGCEPYLPNSECKLWWPHCEALCGLLMAFEECRERWCLDWYRRIHNWSFDHFPDREHGEWTQRLDRQGRRIETVVGLPVKDPFHLPRAIIYAIESLERLACVRRGA